MKRFGAEVRALGRKIIFTLTGLKMQEPVNKVAPAPLDGSSSSGGGEVALALKDKNGGPLKGQTAIYQNT